MRKYYLISLFTTILLLTNTRICIAENNIGLSVGQGKPNSLKGYRLSAATDLYSSRKVNLSLEGSFAKWINNRSDINNLETVSLGPMLRWEFINTKKINTFLQGSIAGARKSSKVVGKRESGSKWTFQDILGFGFEYDHKILLSISYLHYSNGSLAKPNPGIDILPLLTLTFKPSWLQANKVTKTNNS